MKLSDLHQFEQLRNDHSVKVLRHNEPPRFYRRPYSLGHAELAKHGLRRSYNRLGHCTDNAHMESFYHSLKGELIRGRKFGSEKDLRQALSSYTDGFYNRTRLHSGIGYNSPINYEARAA